MCSVLLAIVYIFWVKADQIWTYIQILTASLRQVMSSHKILTTTNERHCDHLALLTSLHILGTLYESIKKRANLTCF